MWNLLGGMGVGMVNKVKGYIMRTILMIIGLVVVIGAVINLF